MQLAHGGSNQCCIAKWQVLHDIELTVVRNGLRNLLPALSSFQPFPSEMFGILPDVSNLQSRLPSGMPALFLPVSTNGFGSRRSRWQQKRHRHGGAFERTV